MNRSTRTRRRSVAAVPAALAATALLLASCGDSDGDSDDSTAAGTSTAASATGEHDHAAEPEVVEAAQPRILTTYDGGILTLDADTLDVIADEKIEGFNRLNPVGDGRHALVSTSKGFQLFDAGVWTEPHGDHSHSYATDPEFTDVVYSVDKPGHVVRHDGKTILFSDGDGKIQVFDTASFLETTGEGDAPEPTVTETEPHHGVAIEMSDGTLVHTEGTEEYRDTVVAVDADGQETARSTECPGVHGEAAAQGEAAAFGCEDGLLVFKDGDFTKIQATEKYARTGNQAGSEESTVVLGDYKTDEDAELERPTKITLTDTVANTTKVVDLGTSYSFRSLGRGPAGEALVLGTDGKLHVLDPESGEETAAWDVIDEWEEPIEWQDARPTLFVQDDRAYVSDPDTKELHVVDLKSGKVLTSAELPEAPNELTGVTG
ncbi:zinc metallochaperone AztD [Corynebacterium variabile]|uniref:Putative secreted protein n=1 Tax=Corynebacterium variabile (strain DSM 44702 / CIP 107183 / JCM 12073 / NCIMB 30131) TaxID=858619 RepID=G0HDL4_CORVD|nr:zinc metallochaperone AztD [Corynebacterium variabile]AEK36023.1 putative secreted protein [Corynebacterium variabile DSM 44702]